MHYGVKSLGSSLQESNSSMRLIRFLKDIKVTLCELKVAAAAAAAAVRVRC
jgi:hypothetical protein